MARKDGIVKSLTDGVAFLFRKNKITFVQGSAKLLGKEQGRRQQRQTNGTGSHGHSAVSHRQRADSPAPLLPPFRRQAVIDLDRGTDIACQFQST